VGTYTLFGLYAVAAYVLIGLLFKRLWDRHDDRAIQDKWRERERLLDHPRRRALGHEIREQRARPAGTQESAVQRGLQTGNAETFARVLFIVARDQRELVGFLHKDYAAEEAEGFIEILLDRRQDPHGQDAPPREANGRRDPRRNRIVSTNLREMGCALVRQPAVLPKAPPARRHLHDPVAVPLQS
jgi:hypothetical protein